MSGKPLSQMRLEVHQEDHPLRALLFGGGTSTAGGLLKGAARAQAADVLNRVMAERLDLVGEISSLRARIAQLEAALRLALDCRGAYNGTVSEMGGSSAICEDCANSARAALSSPETGG